MGSRRKFALTGLAVLSISFLPLAHGGVPCVSVQEPAPDIHGLMNVVPKLTSCEAQYRKEYEKLFSTNKPKESRDFFDHTLEGTKFQLDVLDRVLGINRERLIQRRVPPQAWIKKIESCSEALCSLSKLFQNEESAYRVLNIAKTTGYVFSLDRSQPDLEPQTKIWTLDEIKGVERALKLLPREFYHMRRLSIFKVGSDGDDCVRGAAYTRWQSSTIVFCEGRKADDITYVALHELGHGYDYSVGDYPDNFSQSSGFNAISGWNSSGRTSFDMFGGLGTETFSDPSSFASDYAQTKSQEDFAESIAYYVIRPQKLAAVSSKKYAFIKDKVFKGREYLVPQTREDLEAALGVNSLIANTIPKCLSKAERVAMSDSRGTYAFYRSDQRQLSVEENCSDELRTAIQAKLEQLPLSQRCDLGDPDDILFYVNRRLDMVFQEQLATVLFPIQRDERRFSDEYKKGCLNKKDFSSRCYLQTLFALSPNGLERWKNEKSVQKQIIENLIRGTEKTDALSGLQKPAFEKFGSEMKLPWSKAAPYVDCLKTIESISFSASPSSSSSERGADAGPPPPRPPGAFSLRVSGQASSQTRLSDYCTEHIKNEALSLGYRFDANGTFESVVLKNTLGQKPDAKLPAFMSFENGVLKRVSPRLKECKSRTADQIMSCRSKLLNEAIASWAAEAALDPAELLDEEFLNRLASKIR